MSRPVKSGRLFPKPEKGNGYGLIAIGGDLSPEILVEAYANGVFPWFDFHEEHILWYCPYERFVIFPSEIHVSHSTRNLFNKGIYRITFNTAFRQVIRHCSELRIHEAGAWLGPQMVEAYTRLHDLDLAHSVEVWRGDDLVGGLYGVHMNGVFSGESMFSLEPGTSKLALVSLARKMQQDGEKLIDCQFHTDHLASMGGRTIEYDEYMAILESGR
jgi:leucyl/phenylalanyl-tRNA--protein transferase